MISVNLLGKNSESKKDSDYYLWMLLGLFVNMQIFQLPILGGLSLYNLVIFFICVKAFFNHFKIFISKEKICLYLFFLSLFISLPVCYFVVDKQWFDASLRATLKMSVVMLLLVLLVNNKKMQQARMPFYNGIIMAAYINIAWMIAQNLAWRIYRISLNTILFGSAYYYENNGNIVLSGLNVERASTVLSFLLCSVVSKRKVDKVICAIGVILTSSRTGLILIVILYFYDLFCIIKKKITKQFVLKFLFVISISLIAIYVSWLFVPFVQSIAEKVFFLYRRFLSVFTSVNEFSQREVDAHLLYYVWLPDALSRIPIIQIFFGCGTRVSGWVYTQFYGRFVNYGPWSVECDFVSLVLGNGIFGAFLYYINLFITYKKFKSHDIKTIIIILTFGSFLYAFYTSSVPLLLLILYSGDVDNVSSEKDK